MKNKIIGSLLKKAIKNNDYMPVQDEQGNIVLGDKVNVLIKNSFGSLIILEFIDADRMTAEEIQERLAENGRRLAGIEKAQPCYFLEVFLFDSEPEQEKMELISSAQVHEVVEKKYLKCLSVNLTSKEVTKLYKTPMTGFGIKKLVKSQSEAGGGEETTLEEIKALAAEKEKEYEMEFKTRTPFVSYAFIAINVAMWGMLSLFEYRFGFSYSALLSVFGAKENVRILSGEYWRFVTPIVLHADIGHLLLNCYSIYAVGPLVEKMFGSLKFTAVYLTAGIIGNIASFVFSPNPAVGASGAIFGLLGALLYFGLAKPALFKAYFGYGVITTIVINLVYGFSNARIDNFAHLGGLVGGFLASGAVHPANKRRWYLNRFLFIGLTLLVACAGLLYGFNNK